MKKNQTNAQNAATAAQTNAQNAATAATTATATTAVKVSRKFTFKLYVLPKDGDEFAADAHSGEFCYKSDCHYYAEKQMLDMLKNDELVRRDYRYAIYKISTVEDSKIPDMLIEVAYFNGEKIVIE